MTFKGGPHDAERQRRSLVLAVALLVSLTACGGNQYTRGPSSCPSGFLSAFNANGDMSCVAQFAPAPGTQWAPLPDNWSNPNGQTFPIPVPQQ